MRATQRGVLELSLQTIIEKAEDTAAGERR